MPKMMRMDIENGGKTRGADDFRRCPQEVYRSSDDEERSERSRGANGTTPSPVRFARGYPRAFDG